MSKEKQNGYSQDETVTLTDEAGRELACYIERSLEIDGQDYVLLQPLDAPVEIFAWQEEDDVEEPVLVEDEETLDQIFPIAQAVLSEQELTLKRTEFELTVSGELPPVEEEEILTLEFEDEDGELMSEPLQFLASFYHEEQEYAIYTPLLRFFARMNAAGQPELLSPEEFQKVQPLLEQLFDEMEEE